MTDETRDPVVEEVRARGRTLTERLGNDVHALIYEARFPTSFEDANLVGNVYFAQYGAWQARVRDEFFHTLAPTSYFTDRGARGELCCVETSMSQLRDVMPFDTSWSVYRSPPSPPTPSTSASRTSASNRTRP